MSACSGRLPARPPCGERETEGTMLRMRTFMAALLLPIFIGCGGQTISPSDAGGPGGDDGGTPAEGGGPVETGVPADTGGSTDSLPGSQCVMQNGNWDCDGLVLPQCPAGISVGASCTGSAPFEKCLVCASDGTGTEWRCEQQSSVVGGFSCSP